MRWLRENGKKEEVKNMMEKEGAHNAIEWVEREKVARSVALTLQSLRKVGEGAYCWLDHGWGGEV
jgi:hypothetical protein